MGQPLKCLFQKDLQKCPVEKIQFPQAPKDQQLPTYRTGDYWLIPARTETGDVEWPQEDKTDQSNSQPRAKAMLPHGVEHHYAPLAIISLDAGGNITEVNHSACRQTFTPLTF
jgi:hypothetical protein